jgi:aspartate/methionine/tyrosine aminotransferase
VHHWHLADDSGTSTPKWRLDLDRLRALVTNQTRAILLCNPNNPTGARLSATELDERQQRCGDGTNA